MDLEPAGGLQDDLRFGLLTALLWNVNRDRKKTKAKQPSDFYPSLAVEDEQDADSIKNMMQYIAAAGGAAEAGADEIAKALGRLTAGGRLERER